MNDMNKAMVIRRDFQRQVCSQAIYLRAGESPSISDVSSMLSKNIAIRVVNNIDLPLSEQEIEGQTAGHKFEKAIKEYIETMLTLLSHLRPAKWQYSVHGNISDFVQYQHINELDNLIKHNRQARTALGDYVVKPDVTIARRPATDDDINAGQAIVSTGSLPYLTPLRQSNVGTDASILHASISCKLTIRSDRSQNARTEGLNLIRHRKGHTPHIAVVTAEPMPTRIASIALGTGDIDCVYHFALTELTAAVKELDNEALTETLEMLVEGNRLRDIADLPFDLVM